MNFARSIRSLSHRPRQPRPSNPPVVERNISSSLSTPTTHSSKPDEKGVTTILTTPLDTPTLASESTSSPTPEAADPAPEFPLFSSLPFELRSKIFALALRMSSASSTSDTSAQPEHEDEWWQVYSGAKPQPTVSISWPPLLSVCRESREEAIMYFEGLPGSRGQFKTLENEVVGRMGNGSEKGRKRICVAGWWWDCSVVG